MNGFGNLPMGAEHDSFAPYNEESNKLQKFELGVNISLAKDSVILETNDYVKETCGEDVFFDTKDTNWESEYLKSGCSIFDLLEKLKSYVKDDLEHNKGNERKERELKNILKACDGWEIVDISVEEL